MNMPISDTLSFVRRASQLGTLLHTKLFGREVGRDPFGNRYFIEKRKPRPKDGRRVRQKRWVLYEGEPDASKVPPEWHIWLHYIADAPIPDGPRRAWQKPHKPNPSGTPDAWLPPSKEKESKRAYQAWKP